MKLIILNRGGDAARSISVSGGHIVLAALVVTGVLTASAFAGLRLAGPQAGTAADLADLRASIEAQKGDLRALQRAADDELNALALRMGQVSAQVIRLNALGGRLTSMAGLEEGEFDFSNPPALGGPIDMDPGSHDHAGRMPSLMSELEALQATLTLQQQQLAVLEGQLLNRKLNERVLPNGRPVTAGWVSSYFGRRTDPLTGRSAWHKGMDFAGRYGADIVAVSDGVVSFSGRDRGYGNMVEIRHGNGFVTRYAHNQENLVAVGDKVTQGQRIALMGSTGRSTGPHVHFEVLRNGQPVNPARYIAGR